MATRKVFVEIIGDASSLERAFTKSGKQANKFEKEAGRAGRGVVAVSGLFNGLGRSVAFASGAFLGGAGITKMLRDSVGEADQAKVTQAALAAQFRATGQDLSKYQK